MSVEIKVDEFAIGNKALNAWKKGLQMLSSQVLKDCNKYCKEDTEMLIASSLIHSDLKNGKLVWQTPYAARQYYAIRTAYKDVNPQATWRWVEVAKSNYYEQWNRQAQEIVRYYK